MADELAQEIGKGDLTHIIHSGDEALIPPEFQGACICQIKHQQRQATEVSCTQKGQRLQVQFLGLAASGQQKDEEQCN